MGYYQIVQLYKWSIKMLSSVHSDSLYTHICMHTHAHIHIYIHKHTQAWTHTCAHLYTNPPTNTHMHTNKHRHTCTHKHTQAHINTHAHTGAHLSIHTHTMEKDEVFTVKFKCKEQWVQKERTVKRGQLCPHCTSEVLLCGECAR